MRFILRKPIFWFSLLLLIGAWVILFPVYPEFGNLPWILAHLPERVQQIRPGMTRDRAWQMLGVNAGVCDGTGPSSKYREGCRLGYGYSVSMVIDMKQTPERIIQAKLWKHGQLQAASSPSKM